YCIKYGNSPATIVVGKDAILKRATLHPQFDGFKSGVIVRTAEGEIVNRDGCFKLDTDELVGSWCEVFRKDWANSVFTSCSFSEINQPKNPSWQKQPCVMSEKTAMVRALRSAFVEELGGMYDSAEMDTTSNTTPKSSGFTDDDINNEPEIDVIDVSEENSEAKGKTNKINLEDL
ncbi:MAG: phage recombination protein Bet, partial [Bacteroidales bacterium]|nr:phage recombination protein Bet [Bacteroidales bacterium]